MTRICHHQKVLIDNSVPSIVLYITEGSKNCTGKPFRNLDVVSGHAIS